MQEFNVNNYITLKLENNKTIIYISGKRFRQCKFLFLKFPINNFNTFDEIESIDEAAEVLNHTLEPFGEDDLTANKRQIKITPEVEFWGHCSNLQVWAEHNYDTRFLHSNLSFPLLKALLDSGDVNAKRAFKEEIVKRFLSGNYSTVEFLYEEDYLDYLDEEELWFVIREMNEENFKTRERYLTLRFHIYERLIQKNDMNAKEQFKKEILEILSINNPSDLEIIYDNAYVNYLSREEFWNLFGEDGKVLYAIEKKIKQYKEISYINPEGHKLEKLANHDKQLYFCLGHDITIEYGPMVFTFEKGKITGIGIWGDSRDFPLGLENNFILKLGEIPEMIGELKQLKKLILNEMEIKEFPQFILSLTSLEFLSLSFNKLKSIPKFFNRLKNLRYLEVIGNEIDEPHKRELKEIGVQKKIEIRI